jgi:cardiolipin synthase
VEAGLEPSAASAAGTGASAPDSRVLTVPNALSVLRLLGVPLFLALIFSEHDGWALVVLMIAGFTDYLDGALARRWNQASRLGQLLDPAADRLYILAALVGLVARDIVPLWLVIAVVGRDVLLAGTLPLLGRYGYGPLPVHFLGKAATFNLLYAFPLLLLGDGTGALPALAQVFGWAFALWGVALYWWSGVLYAEQVRRLVSAARVQTRTHTGVEAL